MSIFLEFDVGSSGRRFRKAVDEDKHDIELFLDHQHSDALFGKVNIGSLIELCTLSICMINENKEVIGFMALDDHPNVMGVDPDDWETWIRNMFQRFYLSRNTLFIHFMCCMDTVLDYFLEEACISVFHNDVYLLHIVLYSVCDQEHVSRYQIFKKRTMNKYSAKRLDDSDTRPHVLHVALRQDYCPKMKIRRAVEEDNDDIVKILDKSCPRLKELYGNYYISELIGRHPDSHRKIIVPEYQERAVGVMCLNSDINYKNLQSLYELRPYYGLMKATPLEKEQLQRENVLLSTFGEPIMLGQFSSFDRPSQCLKREENSVSKTQFKEELPQHKKVNAQKQIKVNFKRTSRKSRIVRHHKSRSDDLSEKLFVTSPTLSQISYKSFETLILDEDPFDYEIVNIDKSLLSLAEAFSSELLLGNKSAQSSMQSIVSPQICIKKKVKLPVKNRRDKKESFLSLYSGQENAFTIELYGLREDIDASTGLDLLEVAFEVMQNYDYCIIRVPAAEQPFSLLKHFTFVPGRPQKCTEYSLYIAHRASVLGRLRVRPAELIDIPLIARFLQNTEGSEIITTIEHSCLEQESYQAFVFMSGLSMIGIGILEPPEQLQFVRAKYNIDPYHNHKYHLPGQGTKKGFSAVKVILVYPVFEVHFRFFAREMMRLSGSNSLIWMTAYRNKLVAHKSNALVSAMVPLRPRQYEIDYIKIPELMKVAAMAKGMLPFSTWFLDKKLSSVPVVYVNTRIVILGASSTTMAFLNALLFDKSSSYLRFNNVTLISSYGLPYMRHSSAAVEMMFPKHHTTSEKYLKCVPYTFYVNSVNGIVIEINKQEKYVTLTNGSKYYYDLLFIFVGKEYQHPEYLKPLLAQRMKCNHKSPYIRADIPHRNVEPDYINYVKPDNVFIIKHVPKASAALKYVKNLLTEGFDFKVVVYGATIHAYCCLAALLEMNVPAENIAFVEPFPPEDPNKARVSVFYNSNVDETIYEVLNGLKVEVYRSFYFQSWTTFDNIVTHVEFLSQNRMIKLECNAFFYYGKRGVNTQAFLAVNKSGMAYDGGILIDHQFRTKDASIYAAGPATAYYRRYFAASMKHKYYDSYEIGEKLGNQIRNLLDPLFDDKLQPRRISVRFSTDDVITQCGLVMNGDDVSTNSKVSGTVSGKYSYGGYNKEPEKPADLLPSFVKPKVTYCKLPGGLQYLEVRSPGKKFPHHYVQSLHYKGYVMETFKSGYFKLHMDNDLVVDGITCLTYEKYSLENFRNLYGRTSVMLNHVHLRYTTKKLDDFFEYFLSPWAYFLYHDQTDELFAMVKELLPKGSKTNKGDTLREALNTAVSLIDDEGITKLKMEKKFEASPYVEAVTDYVIDWLSQNDILLPMYMHPSDALEFTHDMGRDPLFRKKRIMISHLLRKVF